MAETILLIDDDASLLRVTEYNLESGGFKVVTASSGAEGLLFFNKKQPDLVITDVKLGDMNGLDVLSAIKAQTDTIPVIVMTAFGSIELAVEAMQQGAFTFLTKPFDREVLRQSCWKALEIGELKNQKELLEEEIDRLTGTTGMETANSSMAELLNISLKAAPSEANILISGESGTGKGVLARLIHRHSLRCHGPMVSVNCASLPATLIESELFGHVKGAFTGAVAMRKGRFQAAKGGTLFLDEIGEMPVELQAKLLRALQEKEVEPVGSDTIETIDVRIIAATNKNLQMAIEDFQFREDLYYRLGVIDLYLPPLRRRKEDIVNLANHFLQKLQAPPDVGFSQEAIKAMLAYQWPGNIRELQNVIERAVILRKGSQIEIVDLNLSNRHQRETGEFQIPPEGIDLLDIEKSYIMSALRACDGNMSEAARLLNIPRHVLIYRIEKYEIPKKPR